MPVNVELRCRGLDVLTDVEIEFAAFARAPSDAFRRTREAARAFRRQRYAIGSRRRLHRVADRLRALRRRRRDRRPKIRRPIASAASAVAALSRKVQRRGGNAHAAGYARTRFAARGGLGEKTSRGLGIASVDCARRRNENKEREAALEHSNLAVRRPKSFARERAQLAHVPAARFVATFTFECHRDI